MDATRIPTHVRTDVGTKKHLNENFGTAESVNADSPFILPSPDALIALAVCQLEEGGEHPGDSDMEVDEEP